MQCKAIFVEISDRKHEGIIPGIRNLATVDSIALLLKRHQTHLFININVAMGVLLSDSSEAVL